MVMLCTPAARVDVWNVALPLLNVPVPRFVAPSRKVTVPVGFPEAADTVPVKVTACPTSTVAAEEETEEVVLDANWRWGTGGVAIISAAMTEKQGHAHSEQSQHLPAVALLAKTTSQDHAECSHSIQTCQQQGRCEFPREMMPVGICNEAVGAVVVIVSVTVTEVSPSRVYR